MEITLFLALIICNYLLGSTSSAVFICKIFNKPDPRKHGSFNPGATNVLRIAGKSYAALVLLCDISKGIPLIGIANTLHVTQVQQIYIGSSAVLGHIFPCYLGFKGGKGVATALGVLLSLSLQSALSCITIFLLTLTLFRIVSISSITATLAAPLAFYYFEHYLSCSLCILSGIIFIKHLPNLKRLRAGYEHKL